MGKKASDEIEAVLLAAPFQIVEVDGNDQERLRV